MPIEGPVLVEGAGLWLDDDFGAPQDAILAVVGEGQATSVELGRSYRAEGLHLVTAHVEHVAKVALDPERALDLDGFGAAVLDADPFVEAAVDEATAANAQALLRDPALALVEEQHWVDHLKGGDIALIDRSG